MEGRNPTHPGGYLLVLLGAVAFVGSCFLPYYDAGGHVPSSVGDPSLFNLLTFFRATSLAGAGGVLTLFGGTATIGGIALVGLHSHRLWAPVALLATSVVWSLTWIGMFLNGTDIFAPHAIGYWAMILSVVVVLTGAIVVWTRQPFVRLTPSVRRSHARGSPETNPPTGRRNPPPWGWFRVGGPR